MSTKRLRSTSNKENWEESRPYVKLACTAPGPPKRKTKKKINRFRQKLVRKKKKTCRQKLGVRKKKKTLAQKLQVRNQKKHQFGQKLGTNKKTTVWTKNAAPKVRS